MYSCGCMCIGMRYTIPMQVMMLEFEVLVHAAVAHESFDDPDLTLGFVFLAGCLPFNEALHPFV